MKIKIWGSRGSIPSPIKSEAIEEKIVKSILQVPKGLDTQNEVAVQAFVKTLPALLRGTVGANTCCVEIQSDDHLIIIDAGSGIRELGIELMKGACGRGEGVIHLLFTHMHWDHIQGFPFFTPAFVPGNRLIIYSIYEENKPTIEEALAKQQDSRYFPVPLTYMQASRKFVYLEPREPFTIGNINISTIRNNHPGNAYSYRIEDQYNTFVFASDAEYHQLNDDSKVQPVIDFFRNADALIFDAQYSLREAWQKVDWGHSSAMIGVDFARAAGVKKLVLFHHDPTYSDKDIEEMLTTAVSYQAHNTDGPTCEIVVGREGMVLDLLPPGLVDLQINPEDDVAVLTPFDNYSSMEQLAEQLDYLEQENSEANSVIDLSQVKTLTTANLQKLVEIDQKRDSPIVLASPSRAIQQVIKLGGYSDYFAVYASVEEALDAVHAREALKLPGHVINGRYKILNKVGEGRLGTVLKAFDTVAERVTSLKILSQAFSRPTIDRFMTHAQRSINLTDPHIVQMYNLGIDGRLAFMAEEFVDSPSLRQKLAHPAETIHPDEALDIALEIVQTLEYAHTHGVIHSDLKPRNIFLTQSGIKISGFGQGRLVEGRHLLNSPFLFMSAPYLSPEQILGQPLDTRTDLYALGAILYELFTGRPPFIGIDQDVKRAHLNESPQPPRELAPKISLSLEHLILKLLAKNPNDRYATAQQARRIASSLTVHAEDTGRQRRRPLIRREQQLQTLKACWQEASQGNGKIVFIEGEQGIGKTSLAHQITTQVAAPVLLVGHCRELKGNPGYDLFADILQSYFATVPPELFDEDMHQLLGNFTRLVPDINRMVPDLPIPPSLEPRQEQLRLMTSLTQFIKQASQKRPWLVLLDDLHWADSSSLELLRYLGHHLATMPILIVATYQETMLGKGHALTDTLRDLKHHANYEILTLDRLNRNEVGKVLEYIWQPPVPNTWVDKIYEHTQGNPFYVEEVAKGLLDDGIINVKNGQWHYPILNEVRLPKSVREVVWRRVRHLGPDTQSLLRQAAVLGQTFRFEELQGIGGLSEWDVLEQLDMALERQLVEEMPGDGMLRFSHAAIQEVLYTDLEPLRRRLLHRTVAEWYETQLHNNANEEDNNKQPLATSRSSTIIALLVYHYHHAEDIEKERYYAQIAGEHAASRFANTEAIAYFTRAIELTPAALMRARYALLLAREQLYDIQGNRPEQSEDLIALKTLAERMSNGGNAAVSRWAQVALRQANYARITGDYEAAVQSSQLAVQLSRTSQVPDLQISGHLEWGIALLSQGDYDAAFSQLAQALTLAQNADNWHLKARSLRNLGKIFSSKGEFDKATQYEEQALQIHKMLGDLQGEAKTLLSLGVCTSYTGNYTQSYDHFIQALRIYRDIGDRRGEGQVLNNLGVAATEHADYETAQKYFEQALDIDREIGNRPGEALRLSNLSNLSNRLNQYEIALEYGEKGLTLAQSLKNGRIQGFAFNNIGNAWANQQKWQNAIEAYQNAIDIRREIGEHHLSMDPLAGLAQVKTAQNDLAAALTYVEEILQHLQEHQSFDGTVDPFGIYLTCYRTLEANQDSRATTILQEAYQALQKRADEIKDETTRQEFLTNVPSHQQVQTLWQTKINSVKI